MRRHRRSRDRDGLTNSVSGRLGCPPLGAGTLALNISLARALNTAFSDAFSDHAKLDVPVQVVVDAAQANCRELVDTASHGAGRRFAGGLRGVPSCVRQVSHDDALQGPNNGEILVLRGRIMHYTTPRALGRRRVVRARVSQLRQRGPRVRGLGAVDDGTAPPVPRRRRRPNVAR